MIEFIDKTTARNGTRINRATLMAMQGFMAETIVFNADGSITEINGSGHTLTTTFSSDGTVVTERFVGEQTITKTTTFKADGSIEEVIS